jgi:O-antigen ligase
MECAIEDWAERYPGTPQKCSAAHNAYVQAGAELGVPGFVLWSAFILGGILGPVVLRRRFPPHWKAGDAEEQFLYAATSFLPVTFAGYAGATFFLSFAWVDMTYYLLGMLAGLYAAVSFKMRQNISHPPPITSRAPTARELRSQRRGMRVPEAVSRTENAPC